MDFLEFLSNLDQIINPLKAIKKYGLKFNDKNEYLGDRLVAFISLILLVGFYLLMGYLLFLCFCKNDFFTFLF